MAENTNTERDALSQALWLASEFTINRYLMSCADGQWSGAEKAQRHDELCRLYVAVFRGVHTDKVRRTHDDDWSLVHSATQELTDNLDEAIGFPVIGRPDYEELAPKFFERFHSLATQALGAARASLSLPAAGQEPVAWLYEHKLLGTKQAFTTEPPPGLKAKCTPLYAAPQPAVAAGCEQIAEAALLKVLTAVQRYLPPDGPSAKDTLSEIIEIVDPWPLAAGEVQWIGASSHAHLPPAPSTEGGGNE